MADRTSAGIFGDMFNYLAAKKKISKEELVKVLWSHAHGYDFSNDQMGADEALVKLGLATECKCGGTVYKGDSADYHDEDKCNPEDWKDFVEED